MVDDPALEAFLERHPWSSELLALGRPLEFLWRIDVKAPLERVWALLIDNSRVNRSLGFDPMQFEERGGVLHGSAVHGGRRHEWIEVPWQWNAGRLVVAMRRYSRGFAHVVRFLYEAEEHDDGVTVGVYFGWIPRSLYGRFCLRIGAASMERGYHASLPKLAESAATGGAAAELSVPGSGRLAPEGEARLRQGKRALIEAGMPADLVERLCEHIQRGDEMELDRLQIKRLARRWDASERELLRVALYATREGLLDLSWDVICPHCRGVRDENSRLKDLPGGGRCEVCEIDFDTRPETAVEVTFHVHPSIRHIQKRWYCAAEPSHRLHIHVQQTLAAGERRTLQTRLPDGLYRARVGDSKRPRLIEVKGGASSKALEWSASDDDTLPLARVDTAPMLSLVNDSERELRFVLEEARWSDEALRPADLFNLVDFRDLFSEEYISADVQLSVGRQTILFTDMVGSTRFYATRGDPDAFAQVKRHFSEVFSIVAAHDGVLVKTIGDAVMAAFADPVQAVRAANAIHGSFTAEREDLDIRLRISLHRGPCIAVQLNSDIDYFGSTVNLAAKLQACVDAGETAVSDVVWRSPGVSELLQGVGIEPEPISLKVAALDDEVPVYRWRWPPAAGGSGDESSGVSWQTMSSRSSGS